MTNLQKALQLHCEWLNKHSHADGVFDSDYKVEECQPHFIFQSEDLDIVYVNGWDDGGGSRLIIFYNRYNDEVDSIIQEFDTFISIVWDDGKFKSLPGENDERS